MPDILSSHLSHSLDQWFSTEMLIVWETGRSIGAWVPPSRDSNWSMWGGVGAGSDAHTSSLCDVYGQPGLRPTKGQWSTCHVKQGSSFSALRVGALACGRHRRRGTAVMFTGNHAPFLLQNLLNTWRDLGILVIGSPQCCLAEFFQLSSYFDFLNQDSVWDFSNKIYGEVPQRPGSWVSQH